MLFSGGVRAILVLAVLFAQDVLCEDLTAALSDEDIYQIIDLATTEHKLERKPEIYYAAAPHGRRFQSIKHVNTQALSHSQRGLSRKILRSRHQNNNRNHQKSQNDIPSSGAQKSGLEIFGSLELPSEHSKYVQDPSGRFVQILQRTKPEIIDGTQKAHVSAIKSGSSKHGERTQLVEETVSSGVVSHQVVQHNQLQGGLGKNNFILLKPNDAEGLSQQLNLPPGAQIFSSVQLPSPSVQALFSQISPSPAPPTPGLISTLSGHGNEASAQLPQLPIPVHQPATFALPAQQPRVQHPLQQNNHQFVHLQAVNAALAKARAGSNDPAKDSEQIGVNSPAPIQNVQLLPQQQQFVQPPQPQPIQYGQPVLPNQQFLQPQLHHQQQFQLQQQIPLQHQIQLQQQLQQQVQFQQQAHAQLQPQPQVQLQQQPQLQLQQQPQLQLQEQPQIQLQEQPQAQLQQQPQVQLQQQPQLQLQQQPQVQLQQQVQFQPHPQLQQQPQYQQPLYTFRLQHPQHNIPVYQQAIIHNQVRADSPEGQRHNQHVQAQGVRPTQSAVQAEAVHQENAPQPQEIHVQPVVENQQQGNVIPAVQHAKILQQQHEQQQQLQIQHQQLEQQHQLQIQHQQQEQQKQLQLQHQQQQQQEQLQVQHQQLEQQQQLQQQQHEQQQQLQLQHQQQQQQLQHQHQQQQQQQLQHQQQQIISDNSQVIDVNDDTLPSSEETLDDTQIINSVQSVPLVLNEDGNPAELTSSEEALVQQAHQHQPEVQIRHYNGEPVVTIKSKRIITRPIKSKSSPNSPAEIKKSVVTTRVVARFKDPKGKKNKNQSSKKKTADSIPAASESDLMTS